VESWERASRMEICFYSKSPDYGGLSNFDQRGSFVIDGLTWPTVEHYYQAQKFDDPELRRRIRTEKTALATKKLAQSHSGEVRGDWDEVKEAVMRQALRAKFSQNRALRNLLLQTGEADLIHQSTMDAYWGRSADGAGLNRLGEMLMEIRAALRVDLGK
jgi:ribA/ribD-fused uncharacterized protein